MAERDFGIDNLEQRREWLHEFLNRLWAQSIVDSRGKSKAILWPLSGRRLLNGSNVPAIEVDVKSQLGNLHVWQEITKRLLVTPSADINKIGLSFYEEGMGGVNKIKLPLDREGKQHLFLEYSNIKGVADLETDIRTIGRFPSRPEQGRGNLKFRVIELFTDTRQDLLKRYTKLNPSQRKIADADLLVFLQNTEMAQNPALKDEWSRLQSTPLTIVELIGRTTYWDKSRGEGVPQPINFAGLRITETLDGKILADKLTPWAGHNSWEAFPAETQQFLATEWQENFKLLDINLTTLLKAFK